MRPVVQEWADTPGRITRRRLDLDDIGAHIAQQTAAEMALQIGQVEDPKTFERHSMAGFWMGQSAVNHHL